MIKILPLNKLKTYEQVKEYVLDSLALYEIDPADTSYQEGHRDALEELKRIME